MQCISSKNTSATKHPVASELAKWKGLAAEKLTIMKNLKSVILAVPTPSWRPPSFPVHTRHSPLACHAEWFKAVFMCSSVAGSNRERRRHAGKSCPLPGRRHQRWATSSSSSILRYQSPTCKKKKRAQPCWPAARQSARWYAGFSQHIFAPLYRSIFWEEKCLRQEILNSRAGSHVTRNKTLPSWLIWCEHLGAGGYCRCKGAIFCVFMGIFVCVSRCLQSRCSARERLHDLFL